MCRSRSRGSGHSSPAPVGSTNASSVCGRGEAGQRNPHHSARLHCNALACCGERGTHLPNILVPDLPGVDAESVHPPVFPLALKLVAARKRVGAAPILQPRLPVALKPRAVRVEADADAVHLALLDMPAVFTLHAWAAARTLVALCGEHVRPRAAAS